MPDSTPPAAARELLARARGELARGHVHAARVALRSLRALLKEYRDLLGEPPEPLRAAQRAMGDARDARVQAGLLRSLARGLSRPDRRPAFAAAARWERDADEAGAVRTARRVLAGVEPDLSRRLGEAPGKGWGKARRKALSRARRRVARRLAAVRGPDDARALHRARIAAKRLRYLLEWDGGKAKGPHRLQDLLGDLRDLDRLGARLRRERLPTAALAELELRAGRREGEILARLRERWKVRV